MDLKRLNELSGKRKRRRRLGTGAGSGRGKTSGRGHKGQKSRSGGAKYLFEGGRMPLFRKIPKRGFSNYPHKKIYEIVNLSELAVFEDKAEIGPEQFRESKLTRRGLPIKVLGEGELEVALTVRAHKFSKSAVEKIEKAGGKAEVVQFKRTVAEAEKSDEKAEGAN